MSTDTLSVAIGLSRYTSGARAQSRGARASICAISTAPFMKKADKPLSKLQAERLARILDTTRQMLAEVGEEGVTIRNLAARSQVAPATLYNRFGNKDHLICVAVVDHYRTVRSIASQAEKDPGPLERLVTSIKTIAKDAADRPAFSRSLMNSYFRIGNDREMPESLYGQLFENWLPMIESLHRQKDLREWVQARALCEELCDRKFGVVMKWCQGKVPQRQLVDASLVAVLSVLLGAARGRLAQEVEHIVEAAHHRLESRRRSASGKPTG